jgi:quercetin dioxygenase-like cupin family protein
MLSRRAFASCALCAATTGLAATGLAATGLVATEVAAQSTQGVSRTILQQTDGPMDGYVTILARAEIQPGAIVMRHTHPGIESAYVLTGGGSLSVKGQPDRQVGAGDNFQIPPYTPHAVHNGDSLTLIAATYVVEKGKPLASPAPE